MLAELDLGSDLDSGLRHWWAMALTTRRACAESAARNRSSQSTNCRPPQPALDDYGCRLWDQAAQDGEDWPSSVLLIPEDAALAVARGWKAEPEAAVHFGVSEQLLTWRLNLTGAR